MHGRSLPIKFSRRGIRADHPVLVTRFEFVSVACKRLEVRDPVVTGSRGKNIMEDERAKRRISTRASATDRHPLSIDFAAFLEIPGRVDAIFDINDPPLRFQPLTIRPAVSGAASVI